MYIDRIAQVRGLYGKPYGRPMADVVESIPGVFVREFTNATVTLNCNTLNSSWVWK